MDEKKFQKAIDAMLHQHATLYSDLEELKELNKAADKRMQRVEKAIVNLFNRTEEHKELFFLTSEQIKTNNDQIAELIASQKGTDERLVETNDRLNAVIFMFEKYLSGQNGKPKK